MWVDVATMLTAGGEAISDVDTLSHQAPLLGPVASAPTVWRSLHDASPASLARSRARLSSVVQMASQSGMKPRAVHTRKGVVIDSQPVYRIGSSLRWRSTGLRTGQGLAGSGRGSQREL